MKLQIPDALKADLPQTTLGKALGATPVVMTVVATLLAGLASSEMTRAQYARSLAAQQQSKAGDQWSFFQAKRLRSALQRSTLDLLLASARVGPFDRAGLERALAGGPAAEWLASADGRAAFDLLGRGNLPALSPATVDPRIRAASDAIEHGRPEPEVAGLLAELDDATINAALRAARDRAAAFDAAVAPSAQAIDRLDGVLRTAPTSAANDGTGAGYREFTAARLRFAGQRYDAEARLNQAVASLYELQVRQSNITAERHHRRSQRFFYGMLAAQAAVIIATFAMVARQRNLLWSIAAAAGLGAVGFGAYVYLNM